MALMNEPAAMQAGIVDLPEHIISDVFSHLDIPSLCNAAQTCRLYLRLAGKVLLILLDNYIALFYNNNVQLALDCRQS